LTLARAPRNKNKTGLEVSQVLFPWAKVWAHNIMQGRGLCPGSQHFPWGPRPFTTARQNFPSSCPFPEAFFPASSRRQRPQPLPHSRLFARSWEPPPPPGTHHPEPEPPNAASTSPSSRHLSRFLVAEVHPGRAAGREGEFPTLRGSAQ
jgi:hypothetical protein